MDHGESAALVERARGGAVEALDELYSRYGRRLLGLIRLRLGPGLRGRLDSADILQATFLRSFQHVGQFEGGSGTSFMAWLARIAENEIRDRADHHGRQRRDARRGAALESAQAVTSHMRTALSRLIADEETARLERALEALDEPHREVIVLRKMEELSWREVAERMGRSEDACRMLLTRALVALTLRMRAGR